MDFEKAYKNLVAKVKNAHLYAQTDSTKNVLEDILPELRESEDERIRKWLLECIENLSDKYFVEVNRQDVFAYLEKQKEQKPSDFPAGFYYIDMNGNRYYSKEFRYGDMKFKVGEQKSAEWSEEIIQKAVKEIGLTQHQIDWFKTNVFPPKQEWSEEDEAFLKVAIAICNRYSHKDIADWLKSLRPDSYKNCNSRWKPSEEKKKETLDGADIGYGLETAIDILENGFTHYQTDDGEYERKQALDVLIFLLNETRKKEDAKLWSKDIVESIITWATEKLQLYSMKESTPYVEAVKNNAQKVLD